MTVIAVQTAEREVNVRDEGCIFCKIANGEIPSNTLYEDEKYRVILDLGPATRGHALILPKDHYADLYELLLTRGRVLDANTLTSDDSYAKKGFATKRAAKQHEAVMRQKLGLV